MKEKPKEVKIFPVGERNSFIFMNYICYRVIVNSAGSENQNSSPVWPELAVWPHAHLTLLGEPLLATLIWK